MKKFLAASLALSLAIASAAVPSDVSAATIGPRKGDMSRYVTLMYGNKAFVSVKYFKRKAVSRNKACRMTVTIARAGWSTWSKRFSTWSKYQAKEAFGSITYVGASKSPATVRVTVDTNGKCWYSVSVF